MSETNTLDLATDEATETTAAKKKAVAKAKAYDWRDDMRKAGELKDRAAHNNKAAGARLWRACQAGITEWLPTAADDMGGESIYGEFLEAYGESRKGDCSKMKTVAVAVRDHGLAVEVFDNLSKAYAEARRLTKTVAEEAAEDAVAEKTIEALAAEAPHSASTPENAAKILLAKGLDEAARLLVDTLGAENYDAHRALVRALTHEVAGRVKAKTKTVKGGPKAGAVEVTGDEEAATPKARATVKDGASKPKAAPVKAEKAAPVKAEKAAPVKAAPVKAAPVKAAPVKAAPVKAAPVKAKPVSLVESTD